MGGIVVSPNPRKNKIYIDANGNEVKPFTKEVIKLANEGNYTPTPEEVAKVSAKKGGEERLSKEDLKPLPDTHPSPGTPLGDIISKKLEEKIEGEVSKALEKIDIGGILEKALDKMFKK